MATKNEPAKPGEKARERRQQQVRDEQIENKLDAFVNVPSEDVSDMHAQTVSGRDAKDPIHIEVAGGVLFVDTHGLKRLDQDAAIGFSKRLSRAVQAIR